MPQIIPIKNLKNPDKITEMCHQTQEPIFIEENGHIKFVIMNMETYERLISTADIDSAIALSEDEIESGSKLFNAEESLRILREKYFD